MGSNFAIMTASSDVLSLDFSVLQDLLTDAMMTNVSCDDKLRACINWILVNEAERKNQCKDILDHTGLLKCSYKFLQLVVRSYMKTQVKTTANLPKSTHPSCWNGFMYLKYIKERH